MEKILIICGPTASGKTSLAIKLAQKYNGELINADSRQLYEGLGIVTGKDLPRNAIATIEGHISHRGRRFSIKTYEREGVPIWLYDLLPTDAPVSISIYHQATHLAISHIRKKGKLPILVGGSGLYIRSIVDNLETIDIPQNESLRSKLKGLNVGDLQDRLTQIDNVKLDSMNRSDRANPRRLLRAIEVAQYNLSGGKSSSYDDKFFLDPLWIGLYRQDRETENAISERVESRWKNGAIDEVREISDRKSSSNIISSLGVGPVQLFIEGKCLENEAKAMWVKEEVAYAKRQMVWFKKNEQISWFDAAENTLYDQVVMRVSPWYTKA